MLLEQIPSRFKNLSSHRALKHYLASPASEAEIMEAERRLGVSFPAQVKSFYQHYNGLSVDDPQLEVLPIERIDFASPKLLHFATLDGRHNLYFDVSKMNDADQWDIVNTDGFPVTVTMASFWTNRMWAWIDKRRAIWKEEGAT